jgi:hypothetical protein
MAPRWLGDSLSPTRAANHRAPPFLYEGAPMSDALKRAQHYRYLAKECWRLATTEMSTEIRKNYLEMAEEYGALADAEELSTLRHENDN